MLQHRINDTPRATVERIPPRRPVFGPHWRGSFMPRVAVFIDWQNVYMSARRAFDLEDMPNERGNLSPYALGRALALGNDRGADGELVRVEVHRGLPSNKWDKVGYAANRRQAQAWISEAPEIIIPRLRPLRYDRFDVTAPPEEKGVDVQLALAALEHVLLRKCDVSIIFSHDTDLAPAVELIRRLKGTGYVETASWRSDHFHSRLKQVQGVHHHYLGRQVFDALERPINWAHAQS